MNFLSLIPKGWLYDYCMEMDKARNEMPLPFHFLSAAAVVGNQLGLNAWATLNKGVRVYPNLNVMLLSPAGKCRRGEGTKITMAIAEHAGFNVLAGKTTPEALVMELIDNPDTILYVEELSVLLSKQDYQRPIIPVLTKLLLHGEGPAQVRTIARGKQTIPRINLTALFTSAPEWFMSTIPSEAFGGGLMSRFLVCCLEERDVHAIDIQADDEASREVEVRLAKALRELDGRFKGHMKGTDDAQRWIEKWYLANETATVEDERYLPHQNRKPAMLLRLAMILAVTSGETKFTVEGLERASALIDWLEPTLHRLYGLTEDIVQTMGKGEKRIIHVLSHAKHEEGNVRHTRLSRSCSSYFRRGVKEMRTCLEGLVEQGVVVPEWRNGYNNVWPPQAWRIRGMDGAR